MIIKQKLNCFFILIAFFSVPSISMAQVPIIYKCIDSDNNITYHNQSTMGKLKCAITDLATKDPVRKDKKESNHEVSVAIPISVPKTINLPSMPIANNEIKDNKPRNPILEKELAFESNQLKTVESMIKNAEDSKDSKQLEQLTKMKNIHSKNIDALNKELGIKTDVELMVKPEVPKNMPLN